MQTLGSIFAFDDRKATECGEIFFVKYFRTVHGQKNTLIRF